MVSKNQLRCDQQRDHRYTYIRWMIDCANHVSHVSKDSNCPHRLIMTTYIGLLKEYNELMKGDDFTPLMRSPCVKTYRNRLKKAHRDINELINRKDSSWVDRYLHCGVKEIIRRTLVYKDVAYGPTIEEFAQVPDGAFPAADNSYKLYRTEKEWQAQHWNELFGEYHKKWDGILPLKKESNHAILPLRMDKAGFGNSASKDTIPLIKSKKSSESYGIIYLIRALQLGIFGTRGYVGKQSGLKPVRPQHHIRGNDPCTDFLIEEIKARGCVPTFEILGQYPIEQLLWREKQHYAALKEAGWILANRLELST